MLDDFYSRTYGIFGDGIDKLKTSHVAVVGLGGVGGSCAIALARSGVGEMTIVDGDKVVKSNLNRQAVAFNSTLGKPKARVMADILLDINPDIKLHCFDEFWHKDNEKIDINQCDFVVDAIDSVNDKIDLIKSAKDAGIPIISATGAGNKVDPTRLKVADITKTDTDPLCKVLRKRLKEANVSHLLVVYSDEVPRTPFSRTDNGEESDKGDYVKRVSPASCSFMPPAMGLVLAGEVIKRIAATD